LDLRSNWGRPCARRTLLPGIAPGLAAPPPPQKSGASASGSGGNRFAARVRKLSITSFKSPTRFPSLKPPQIRLRPDFAGQAAKNHLGGLNAGGRANWPTGREKSLREVSPPFGAANGIAKRPRRKLNLPADHTSGGQPLHRWTLATPERRLGGPKTRRRPPPFHVFCLALLSRWSWACLFPVRQGHRRPGKFPVANRTRTAHRGPWVGTLVNTLRNAPTEPRAMNPTFSEPARAGFRENCLSRAFPEHQGTYPFEAARRGN